MKVWVVQTEWAADYESENSLVVFSTKTKELKCFNELVKKNTDIDKKQGRVIEIDDCSYTSYEEGFYAQNHCTVIMKDYYVN